MKMEQTRRDFLRMAGKSVMGAAALTAIPAVLSTAKAETEAPAYPWTWQKVDKTKVMERTYAAFSTHGGCCASVVAGIMEELAEQYGYPYNQFPARAFANGAGGYGNQTLCGALGGACAVIGLFCAGKTSNAVRNALFDWYKGHEFPQYQPVYESPYSVSNSIQCADSVSNWMKVSGKEFSSPERAARCAGLSAEVAVKVVELLNIEYGFEAAPVTEEQPTTAELGPNEYIGVAKGFNGDIKVKVTMDGDKIANIQVLENSETAAIAGPALEKLPKALLGKTSVEGVDIVSGATYTSNGLIAAVKDALSQVK